MAWATFVYSTLLMCRHKKRSVVFFWPALLACRPLSPVRFPHETGSCQRCAITRPSPDGCVPAAGCRLMPAWTMKVPMPARGHGASQHEPRVRRPCLGGQQIAVRARRVRRRGRPPCHTGRGQSCGMRGGQIDTGPRRGLRGGRVPSNRTAAAHRHPQPAPSSGKRRQSEGTARPCIIRIVPAVNSWYTCSRHKDASLW